jgi:hypothetical protein
MLVPILLHLMYLCMIWLRVMHHFDRLINNLFASQKVNISTGRKHMVIQHAFTILLGMTRKAVATKHAKQA